jgi:hypothetical protein
MTATALRRCRPVFDRPRCLVPACGYADPDGRVARQGRVQLRAALTAEPDPLTEIDARYAAQHVTDRMAALYGLGAVVLGGMTDCTDCGHWVPSLHAADPATRESLDAGCCPYHGGD